MSNYLKSFICSNQAKLFAYAFSLGLDIETFIEEYMQSSVASKMDKSYSLLHTQSVETIFEYLKINKEISCKKNPKQKINLEAIEWLGFFYRKWHFLTNESSKQILRFLSPKEGLKGWYKYHQIDESEVIYIIKEKYNLKKNNHRKNEVKKSLENRLVESFFKTGKGEALYHHPQYFSFLAKRILFKLNKDPKFLELEYTFDRKYYDFITPSKDLGIKTKTFSYQFKENIIFGFNLDDFEAMFYKVNTDLSILFYFAYNEDYEDADNLLKDINELIRDKKPSQRKYEYIYIYSYSKLYEISDSNELNIYSIPLSSREKRGIANEMKKYGLLEDSKN